MLNDVGARLSRERGRVIFGSIIDDDNLGIGVELTNFGNYLADGTRLVLRRG